MLGAWIRPSQKSHPVQHPLTLRLQGSGSLRYFISLSFLAVQRNAHFLLFKGYPSTWERKSLFFSHRRGTLMLCVSPLHWQVSFVFKSMRACPFLTSSLCVKPMCQAYGMCPELKKVLPKSTFYEYHPMAISFICPNY